MRVTVNWIRAALKVTACYIPAADSVLNINQTTKDKDKITHCSSQKVFCSFNKKQGSLILTVKTTLFYFTFDYSISIVGC